jgi:hypothetical protein
MLLDGLYVLKLAENVTIYDDEKKCEKHSLTPSNTDIPQLC